MLAEDFPVKGEEQEWEGANMMGVVHVQMCRSNESKQVLWALAVCG